MAMEEVASTSSSTSAKRSREQEPWESPEAKRLREDLLFDILGGDDDEETGIDLAYNSVEASTDLADVMRSFEEEIAASVSPASATSSTSSSSHEDEYTYAADASDVQRQQLGFLLEASDDELGLPPPGGDDEQQQQQFSLAPVSSHEGVYQTGTGLEETNAGSNNYWRFQDEEVGFMTNNNLPVEVGEALANLDGAAFGDDYGDVYLSWPSDLADFSLVA